MTMMNKTGMMITTLVGAAALVGTTTTANAQSYNEDFESYSPGTVLDNVGGWKGWDNDPTYAGVVSDAQAHGGTNSILVEGGTDAVHPLDGFTSGQYAVTAWTWADSSSFSGDMYFILNNEYNDGGPYEWIIQTRWTTSSSMVEDAQRSSTDTPQPIVFDEWVELRIEIDLDGDTQTTYYNGAEVSTGQLLTRGGPAEIANIDLFTTGGTIYFDDISIEPLAGGPELTVSGTCPGSMTFEVNGATPDGNVAYVYAFGLGSVTIPNGPCAGTSLDLDNSARLAATDTADGSGVSSLTRNIPDAACDNVFVQALDVSTCTTTEVLAL